MARTLFDKYGGFSTVRQVVSSFYDKVLDEDSLAHHFENTDMRRLIDHQTQFISSLMGGPGGVSDDILRRVHENLSITKSDFALIAELLKATLFEYSVEPADADFLVKSLFKKEVYVVSKND